MKYRYEKINKLQLSVYNSFNNMDNFKVVINKINSDEIDHIFMHSTSQNPILIGKARKRGLFSQQLDGYNSDYSCKIFSLNTSKINSLSNPILSSGSFNSKSEFLNRIIDDNSIKINVPYLGELRIFKVYSPEQCAIFSGDKLIGLCTEGTITLKTEDIKEISILNCLFYFLNINNKWKTLSFNR